MINAAIVDDDPEFLEIMAHELEKTKFFSEIKTSSDPQQFLAQLHQDSPDVLFLDIEMPEINGFFVPAVNYRSRHSLSMLLRMNSIWLKPLDHM